MSQKTIVLLTATVHETNALKKAIGETAKAPSFMVEGRKYWDYGEIGGARVLHLQTGLGDLKARKGAEHAIANLAPSLLLSVGIAWGSGKKPRKNAPNRGQEIGDILLAEELVDWSFRKESEGKGTIPRGWRLPARDELVQTCRACFIDWQPKEPKPQLRNGILLTAPILFDDYEERQKALKEFPEAIGGEMEGRGIVDVANDKDVDWLILKAICDWGYGKNAKGVDKDAHQALAAENAATFVVYLLRQGLLLPSDMEGARPLAAGPLEPIGQVHGSSESATLLPQASESPLPLYLEWVQGRIEVCLAEMEGSSPCHSAFRNALEERLGVLLEKPTPTSSTALAAALIQHNGSEAPIAAFDFAEERAHALKSNKDKGEKIIELAVLLGLATLQPAQLPVLQEDIKAGVLRMEGATHPVLITLLLHAIKKHHQVAFQESAIDRQQASTKNAIEGNCVRPPTSEAESCFRECLDLIWERYTVLDRTPAGIQAQKPPIHDEQAWRHVRTFFRGKANTESYQFLFLIAIPGQEQSQRSILDQVQELTGAQCCLVKLTPGIKWFLRADEDLAGFFDYQFKQTRQAMPQFPDLTKRLQVAIEALIKVLEYKASAQRQEWQARVEEARRTAEAPNPEPGKLDKLLGGFEKFAGAAEHVKTILDLCKQFFPG